MKEAKTELKLSAAYLIVLAAWVLGVDIQSILLMFMDVEQYTKDLRVLVTESAGREAGVVAGGAVVGIYNIARTWLKNNAD
jgi:hypothetical protein